MSTHRRIDEICIAVIAFAVVLAVLFANGERLGLVSEARELGYETRLFDRTKVHTIDIVADDWEGFIETCTDEEYIPCAVVIDGKAYKNVAIRAKGNTSLTTVASMNSDRYSFKIEFDHYDKTKSYYGLDKLCLNNIIQDNTYMKDYLVYTMMYEFGVAAPLCSFTYITVNGEEWGLYLAVEGVEDGFMRRNYNGEGALYKPDSQDAGGGRGNGRDFDISEFQNGEATPPNSGGFKRQDAEMTQDNVKMTPNDVKMIPNGEGAMHPEGDRDGGMGGDMTPPEGTTRPFDFGGGMNASDVKLQYIDDDAQSYPNVFDNAKTKISEADKARLISSLKSLSAYEDIDDVVDVERVAAYFVLHSFVDNGDSYTGSMVHNYYLYENDGVLSMIPWDYNLAFGTFQSLDASSSVNAPIDSPAGGDEDDRPMVGWIFSDESYTALYHELYRDFVERFFKNGRLDEIILEAFELIAPYVEKDPTKFCTYDEFLTGVAALRRYCELRFESVLGQLDGTIPSTVYGQNEDSSSLVDVGDLDLSDMGTMNGGFGKDDFDNFDKDDFGGFGKDDFGNFGKDDFGDFGKDDFGGGEAARPLPR